MATKSTIHYKTDKLYTLKKALDPAKMREVFEPMTKEHFGEKAEVRDVNIEVLRKRNQRCVIRYRVVASTNGNGAIVNWPVIGKVYKINQGEEVFEFMKELWTRGFQQNASDKISIPEPYAFSTPMSMLFQEEVPGKPVKQLLKENLNPAYMRQLARTLAKLHSCGYVPGPAMTLDDHLLRCHPRYPFLFLACPELAPQIEQLLADFQTLEKRWANVPLAPIHGDLHMGQLHLQDESAYLIDFDALSYGDPAADIGNLVVFLKGKLKREPRMAVVIDALYDEYFKTMDPEIRNRVPYYEAITHLRRACKLLRYQKEGWRKRIAKMIQQAEDCIREIK